MKLSYQRQIFLFISIWFAWSQQGFGQQTTVNFNSYIQNQGLSNPHVEGELRFEAIKGASATCTVCVGIDINEGKNGGPGLDDSNQEIGGIIGWKISRADDASFQFLSIWLQDRDISNALGTSDSGTIKAFKGGAQVGGTKTINFDSGTSGLKSFATDPDFFDVDYVLIEGVDLFLILDEVTYNDPFVDGDNTAPAVLAINLIGAPLSTATSVTYNVEFSKIAQNVSVDDFELTKTGSANGTIASVTGSNATYSVLVTGLSGEGTIRLDIKAGTDIANENNVSGTAAFTAGQLHNISPCLVEDFEDETDGSKTFSYGGNNFSITGNLEVQTQTPSIGINGSRYVLLNTGSGPYIINSLTKDIGLKKFAVFLSSDDAGNFPTNDGSITVVGKKDGSQVYSITKTSGFPTDFSANSGYYIFDLSTEGGADNSKILIDQLEISLGSAFQYINIDNFEFCIDLDVINPVIENCPTDIIVSNDAGQCGAAVSWTPPTATDNSGAVNFVSNFESGAVFPVGTTEVTYTATDESGNQATCSFTVKVNDTTPPVPPTSPETLNLQCIGDVPAPYELTAIDNCSGEIKAMPTVTQQSTGPTSVAIKYEWAFIDATGNAVFVEQIINVSDNLAPVPPTAPADLNLQCGSNIPGSIELTAIDNCDGKITVNPSIQLKPGASPNDFELIYTWTFTDASGNSSSISQKIIVKDDIAPVPTAAPADLNLQCASELPPVVDLTAIDNCLGPITVSPTVTIAPGASPSDFVEVRTWTFVDADGNSSNVSQRIVVRDNIPPSFEFCSGDINETVAFGETGKIINYLPAVASDNCSVPAIVLTSGLASGSIFPLGTTTVTYVATDEAGNSAECSFDVTVTADPDTEDPVISNCPPDFFVSNDEGECGAIFRLTEPTATDNSGFVDLVSNFKPGDFFPVGTTRVTYTATDAAGNQATCSFDVTVVDNELPEFGSVSDINVTVPSGQTVTSVSVPEPTVSDNCSATVTGVRNDGMQLTDPYPLGETTITWSAKDAAGNEAVDVQQKVIVVEDKQKVTRFVLVNSQTDEDLFEITEGMEIDSDLVKGMQLNIRAETNPSVVGSVFMRITGPVGSTKTENVAPYALFGDNNGNYSGRSLPNGNYTMSAVPYTLSGRSGEEGVALTVNFSIVRPPVPVSGISVDPATAEIATGSTVQLTATIQPSNASNKAVIWGSSNSGIASVNSYGLVTGNTPGQAIITATSEDGGLTASATITVVAAPNLGIVSFTLINSDTDVDMFELTNGMVINQSQINGLKLNVRANTNPSIVGSVYIKLSGPVSRTTTENVAPYALFGDKNGNYSGKTLTSGTYTLTAMAYSESGRKGTAGPEKTITFTIVSNAFRTETETDKPENDVMENEKPAIEIQRAYSLKAFPNPVQDGRVSIVDSRFGEGKVKYILFSITGSKLSEGEAEIGEGKAIRLDFSGNVTQAGMYILILDYDKYPSLQRVQLIFE
ncbi:HYR domain-containing protein [Aquiflexum gelatinilyticum]|uniref:HYR domain-containing protein n=1 Tax=Aquiflexum gelatinilyticum TaxID=2961943 RepID=UPI002166F485|nr:HYR domain-containing protein [Aquiflexum gelatinilyticum]MCS4435330.1 HYR domain-containing protein [Aquiflexum gelatinilyticum]